jgi:hypothetical protein
MIFLQPHLLDPVVDRSSSRKTNNIEVSLKATLPFQLQTRLVGKVYRSISNGSFIALYRVLTKMLGPENDKREILTIE